MKMTDDEFRKALAAVIMADVPTDEIRSEGAAAIRAFVYNTAKPTRIVTTASEREMFEALAEKDSTLDAPLSELLEETKRRKA